MLDTRILFIDGEAIVIDKPAGIPVDAPRAGGDSIARRIDDLKYGFKRPPVAMHRLDQDTSGCLLFARHASARVVFQAAFEAGTVEKTYLAVLAGEVGEGGVIDVPLGKISSEEAGWRMRADPAGKSAITHWRRIALHGGRSLVEFRPKTGRTHQIRAHAREGLGVGIVGDFVYGVPGGPMLLHALRLVVPRGKKPAVDVTAPLPASFGEWRALAETLAEANVA